MLSVTLQVVNNKQYTIEIVFEDQQYKVVCNWGAIGRKPTRPNEEKKPDICASLAVATGILEKTLVEKKKKGYVVVRDSGVDTAGAGSSAKRKTTDETAPNVPPSGKKKRPAKQAVSGEKEGTDGAESGKGSKKAA